MKTLMLSLLLLANQGSIDLTKCEEFTQGKYACEIDGIIVIIKEEEK